MDKELKPEIKKEANGSYTISVNIEMSGSMLSKEEQIARAVAAIGAVATREALESFDTDGSAVIVENRKYTSKGTKKKSTRRRTDPRK